MRSSLDPVNYTIRSKGSRNQGDKSNKQNHDNKNHRLNANSYQP